MFARDIVLFTQNHRKLEEDLEIGKSALERRAPKANRSKSECVKVGGADVGEKLKLLGDVVTTVKIF